MDTKKSTSPSIEAPPKPTPAKALGDGGATAPLELVRVALVSGVGGSMVVTKKDGLRLAQSGRWKIVGAAEMPALETQGRPGAPSVEEPPALSGESDTKAGPVKERAAFGEDHED